MNYLYFTFVLLFYLFCYIINKLLPNEYSKVGENRVKYSLYWRISVRQKFLPSQNNQTEIKRKEQKLVLQHIRSKI